MGFWSGVRHSRIMERTLSPVSGEMCGACTKTLNQRLQSIYRLIR